MREKIELSDGELSLWKKEVRIVHLTGWVCEEIQVGVDELSRFLFHTMKEMGRINSAFLSRNFGIHRRTSKKLLETLIKNHPEIVLMEKTDERDDYFLKNDKLDIISEEIKTTSKQTIKSYSIIIDPLIFINRRLRSSITDSQLAQADSEVIISSLKKLNQAIVAETEKGNYFVPHEIKELFLDKLYVRGYGRGTLQHRGGFLTLLSNNVEYARITSQHPSYYQLYEELVQISRDTDSITNSIHHWLEKQVSEMNFELRIDLPNKELIVRTNESNIVNFGILFKFYRNNNEKTISFPIKNGWILQIPVKIEINDLEMSKLFNYFSRLQDDIKEDYMKVFAEDKEEFEEKVITTWRDETGLPTEPLIRQLKIMAKNRTDEWLYHILARLQEGSIFE